MIYFFLIVIIQIEIVLEVLDLTDELLTKIRNKAYHFMKAKPSAAKKGGCSQKKKVEECKLKPKAKWRKGDRGNQDMQPLRPSC